MKCASSSAGHCIPPMDVGGRCWNIVDKLKKTQFFSVFFPFNFQIHFSLSRSSLKRSVIVLFYGQSGMFLHRLHIPLFIPSLNSQVLGRDSNQTRGEVFTFDTPKFPGHTLMTPKGTDGYLGTQCKKICISSALLL